MLMLGMLVGRRECCTVSTQDNTPPGSIFKAEALHSRMSMIASPEKGGIGKIDRAAARKRVVRFWNRRTRCGVTEL